MEKQIKLTTEQETLFAGYYDTLASYFGGDPIQTIIQDRFKGDKIKSLKWMEKTSKKLDRQRRQKYFGWNEDNNILN
jgi:hypothetical protein